MDYNTTGIILVTNNGNLSHKLTHPKFGILKKYIVCTDGKITKNEIKTISNGLRINKKDILKAKIKSLNKINNKYNWDVTLTQGKNREIKRIFNYYDINVFKIHRYEFAGIILNNLALGKYRKINKKELKLLVSLF